MVDKIKKQVKNINKNEQKNETIHIHTFIRYGNDKRIGHQKWKHRITDCEQFI